MDRSIPLAAQPIIKFLYQHETRGNYEAISSFKQAKLSKKLTSMTVDEVLTEGPSWINKYGTLSSAAGAPQIINKTLRKLKEVMNLTGKEKFSPDLQDRMAMQLLRFRGYDGFMAGQITAVQFARNLAQEWASMPVLEGTKGNRGQNIKRGQSYYDGDGLNAAASNSAGEFERILTAQQRFIAPTEELEHALGLAQDLPASINAKPADTAVGTATKVGAAVATGAAVIGGAKDAVSTVTDWQPVIDLAYTVGKYGPAVAGGIVAAVVVVVIAKKVLGK